MAKVISTSLINPPYRLVSVSDNSLTKCNNTKTNKLSPYWTVTLVENIWNYNAGGERRG